MGGLWVGIRPAAARRGLPLPFQGRRADGMGQGKGGTVKGRHKRQAAGL